MIPSMVIWAMIVFGGNEGKDRLDGGEGNDQLYGGSSNDSLNGGIGNDILNANEGNDLLLGGEGNDAYRFDSGWGSDVIQIENKNGNDVDTIEFVGIDSNDLIIRKVGQDMQITHRVTGDQLLVQSQFNEYSNVKPIQIIRFDDNTQWNVDEINIQAVKGTELGDVIEGVTDHDVIHAGDGDDVIRGSYVYSQNPEGQYFVYGEAGNDIINGSGYLDGGLGNDNITGLGHLLGGDGNDTLTGQGVLEGQAGDDSLSGQGVLSGGDGDDQLDLTGLGSDAGYVSGGTGNDTITIDVDQKIFVNVNNANDFMQDADGYHVIQESETPESEQAVYIDGGQGNDTIYGSFGNEVYLFNLGDGQDTIIERRLGENFNNVAVSFDVLRLGEEIATTDISLHRHGSDLVIQHTNNTDQITVQNYFTGGHHKINQIQFGDLTVWDNSYIENHLTYHGTVSNDEVWGYRNSHEIFEMGAGADKVYSGSGNDIIHGQAGNDVLWGQLGNDTLYGGLGADYIEGNEGADILHGDQDNDTLYGGAGDDLIYGNEGSDILRGHSGVDILDGGAGDDKYFYYLTDGPDEIDQIGGGVDVLWLMDNGITRDRIQFTKEENDLIVTIDNNTNQSVRIVDHFLGGEKAISAVQPNNGYTISKAEINALFASEIEEPNPPIEGGIYDTSANDTLVGGAEDNVFFYTAGKDTIQDAGGIDILRFSNGITFNQVGSGLIKTGNDLVLKVNGSTTNQVTLKNYFLAGDHLIETIDFETGGQLTAEQIFNAFGVTLPEIEEETGSTDAVGDTTYQYTTGEFTITEQSGADKVIFKNGIGFSQVANYLTMFGDDLILKVDGSNTNKVTIKNFFLAGQYLVEAFQFETGGQLSAEQIFGAFGITMPTTEPDNPTEPESPNVVGNTTYDYTTGALTITEQSGNDKVVFKNGIGFSQVANYLTMSGDDLILKVDGSNTNKVTVKNFFLAGEYLVEIFQFETGGQITAEQIFGAFGLTVPEQNNPETTQPETGLEAMNSTYTYTSGTLQIDEDYGVDEIVFSNGITFNQVASSLMMSGDDLVLKINGSNTDKVTIKSFFLGGAHEVESLSFETGGSISSSQIYQAFGLDRPLNAEDEVNAVVLGDTGDNILMSDAAVSELFILDQGQDIIQLLQNTSGETARDYVSDFSLVEDKIDLSAVFVNSQVNNSNLDDYLQVFYDADAKTNTLSVRTSVNNAHKDMLIFTNQAEQLYVEDLLLNQAIMY